MYGVWRRGLGEGVLYDVGKSLSVFKGFRGGRRKKKRKGRSWIFAKALTAAWKERGKER